MDYLIVLGLILGAFYCIFIFSALNAWEIGHTSILKQQNPPLGTSVIIAARNEENIIQNCLNSILANDVGLSPYEIIVIDDNSDDGTLKIIQTLQSEFIKILSLPIGFSGKKSAIAFGVSEAKFPIILCTDADCVVGKSWVQSHASIYIDDNAVLATGVVLPDDRGTRLSRFQFFDFSASMIITNYGILKKLFFLGNGANISFRKVVFEMAAGYTGNNHIASGDDVFLMESVVRLYPNGINFVRSQQGMVVTKSEDHWTSLINQRIRWASKSMLMDGVMLKSIQAFVFFYSLFVIVLILLSLLMSTAIFLTPLMIALFLKLTTDFIFLNRLSHKFERIEAMRSFIFCFWIYFVHIIGSGIVALFPKSYTWKGRNVS